MGAQFLLLPTKMLLLLSCLAATAFASPLQFERVPSLDNRIPLLVQDRVPNPCLTKANDTCIFPFKYNGVEYYRCTYADSPTPWCATMVDPNNTVVTNNWGDCSTSQFSNCPEDTPDLPLHLAGEDLQLLHQGRGRPGQALVLHNGRPGRQPYHRPGTIRILLSSM